MHQSLLSAQDHCCARLRKRKFACVGLLLLMSMKIYAQAPSDYSLVWSDEFTANFFEN
jgi:hypothetical protein